MRKWACVFLLIITLAIDLQAADLRDVRIDFYSNLVDISYDYKMDLPLEGRFNPRIPDTFSYLMENSDYKLLIDQLRLQKEELQLSDWLYYLLVKQTTDKIFSKRDYNYKTMVSWFLMAKSGYKVMLFFDDKKVYLFAQTKDRVFEVPFIKVGDEMFVNISNYTDQSLSESRMLSYTSRNYIKWGKSFTFRITSLPTCLPSEIVSRKLKFVHDGIKYELKVQGDKTLVNYIRQNPKLDLPSYAAIPMSKEAYESLVPTFRAFVSGKSPEEAVRLILSFTRTAFVYKTDEDAYHEESVTFSPEQTLLSPYSDCEDRAILFTYMVKEVLGLDAILLEYPTHISAAVQFARTYGQAIESNGKRYSICEPTGPQNDLDLGELPNSLKGVSYRVVE